MLFHESPFARENSRMALPLYGIQLPHTPSEKSHFRTALAVGSFGTPRSTAGLLVVLISKPNDLKPGV